MRGYNAGGKDPEGPHPLENHKTIRFLSNTGLDPLAIHKAAKSAFNVGQLLARERNAIGEQMVAHF